MLKQILSAIKISTLALILSFGLSYALAWTAPTQNPPNGNVAAPINVSGTAQIKTGALTVGGLTTGTLNVTTGAGDAKVLTSDASGNATWQVAAGGSDNLGDHTATQALNMAGNDITNAGYILQSIIHFKGTGGDSGQAPNYYGIYQESGPWSHPYPDLKIGYHTGIKYDAYYGYGGHRFYTGYDGTGNPAGQTMSIGDGDQNVRVTNSLIANDVYSAAAGKWMSQMGGGGGKITTASAASIFCPSQTMTLSNGSNNTWYDINSSCVLTHHSTFFGTIEVGNISSGYVRPASCNGDFPYSAAVQATGLLVAPCSNSTGSIFFPWIN